MLVTESPVPEEETIAAAVIIVCMFLGTMDWEYVKALPRKKPPVPEAQLPPDRCLLLHSFDKALTAL